MSETKEKILILGGTKEAAALANELVAVGHNVVTSLAGRTREPAPLAGKTRIGGFGGAEGLAAFLLKEGFHRFIDATHPFAKQISENARMASKQSGIPLEIRCREPWQKQTGDHWIDVEDLSEAKNAIPSGARVLLALGSQHIDVFENRSDVFFVVRMVDPPQQSLPLPNHLIVLGKPSADWHEESALLDEHAITHIVCRNSGGKGAYAKIEAARNLGLPVIMVARG